MEEKKDNKVIPFLLGLFMGWVGVKLLTHLIYLIAIASLIVCLVIKK